jgi:uncharacterized membrane protein YfcA
MALGLILATLVGIGLGVLGAGGSIVTVPLLVYVVGLDPQHAAATSLLVVGVVSAVGAALRWQSVRARTGVAFGAAGVVGVPPGVWLAHHVPGSILLGGFGVVLLLAATRMLRAGDAAADERGGHPAVALAGGAAVGFATGFFGVGGGFLIVPALTMLAGLDLSRAAATSLLVIALNCAAGLIGHGAYGVVEWRLGLAFAGVALLAAMLAMPFAARLSSTMLRNGFAAILLVLGTGMLAGSLGGPWR